MQPSRGACLPARILIVDGVPAASQDLLVSHGGRHQGENYVLALASQAGAIGGIEACIIAAAEGEDLPSGTSLPDFDGVAWTGSPLNIYNDTPIIRRKVAFARAAFEAGVPCFGSCWGLQLMMVALGGKVHKNPRGPQLGFARAIQLTDAGRAHPMYRGKPAIFDAICVHQDEVCDVPDGVRVLAGNRQCDIQAAAVRDGHRSFWGVQYHPEFDLHQISAMWRRSAQRYVDRGLVRTIEEMHAICADLKALHDDHGRKDIAWKYGITQDIVDTERHRVELANWLRCEVAPHAMRRGR
jgi:GMP synthase (glutamine-hydrolysing)